MKTKIKEIMVLGRKVTIFKSNSKILKKDFGYFVENKDGLEVWISSTLSEDMFKRVVKHELTHALLTICGMARVLGDEKEEAICDLMENFPHE